MTWFCFIHAGVRDKKSEKPLKGMNITAARKIIASRLSSVTNEDKKFDTLYSD